ncbi:SMP-30/gluconolactonase/LRE family protein [Methylobacterium durans]|uniref:Gluconolactonase n=1 Tax=Methylobacterium durans TaxID=2202825 RepID=A0A2U8WFP5_9HYPH|nr:SMP-30/gluconolactonase/LRE family protein [Methylobacterium durans]AWN44156.1 gluconolactonase [Methylobacterium durans]
MAALRRRDVLATGILALALPRPARAAPVVRSLDPRFAAVADPASRLETIYTGGRWCEGLCPAPHLGGLVFSDVKANRICVLGEDGRVRPFRDPSNNANGNALDREGRLVTCEHRGRRVVRREPDGRLTVLADSFAGKPLNSPNDAVLGPDGAIWFTDPIFGIRLPDEGVMAESAQRARRVYRVAQPGRVEAMTDAADQPNGLAFAPDGGTFYLSDAGAALQPEGASAILAFPVGPDQRLGAPRLFAEIETGAPDGLTVDAEGRLYAACEDGVRVFDPDGTWLGRIATPRAAANVALGGPDRRRLTITAGPAIHAIDLKVAGAG